MKDIEKRFFSGVKPSGRPHIGNYLGAMRQFVDLQETVPGFVSVVDYHALTSIHGAKEMRALILGVALDYLAIGLDPKKVVIFQQSQVPAHTELCWVFNTITTMPYLMRAHAFKDAEAKNKDISVGTFDYPMLMAADILLYDTTIVPVGQDQKQHVEFARDTAEKFNRMFADTFVMPEARILKEVAVIPGTDGKKMSKSHHNTIPLFAEDAEIETLVMSIVTDSKKAGEPLDPETCTLFSLHRHFSKDELPELEKRYLEGTITYKASKELLLDSLKMFIRPLRERRAELAKDPERAIAIIGEGSDRARDIAEEKMRLVRTNIGVSLA